MSDLKNKISSILDDSLKSRINDIKHSISLAYKALDLCSEFSLDDMKAECYSKLSLYHMIEGKYDLSFNFAQKSLLLFEKFNNEKGIADVKFNIASFYYKTNNFQLGVVYLVDSLIIYKKNNDYYNISRCEKSLGTVYAFTGDDVKAIQANKNAIKAAKKVNDLNLISNAYNNLSGIYIKNDQIDLGMKIIQESIEMKQKTKDTRGLAFAIYGRGKVFLKQKKYAEAEKDFLEAIAIHNKIGEFFGLAMAYNKLGKLYFETNKTKQAKKQAELSINICNFYSISITKIKVLYLFYSIYKSENNLPESLRYLELYINEKETVFNAQNFKVIENYDLLVRMQAMQKEAEFQQEKTKIIAKSNKTEQAARIRQEFLSTMSHEIRTPLNAVTTIATMLSENSHVEDKVLVDSLKFSSNHLMQIINDILDFTKLDLGKMSLDLQSCKIKFYLENFWNTYQIQAHEKGIEFKLKLDPLLFDYYLIDQTKITQILANLVTNAIKFTDIGAVKLEVKITKQSKGFDTILFKISDTGVGIEKENLKQVFESFSQLKSGITRKKDGTGLGLSISKKLIELHESEIEIQSIFGKGSIFSFELKLKKSKNFEINDQENFKNNMDGIKVLLAEDNAINAMIAKKLLSNWGIITDHAINGLVATEKSKLQKYDYILMDIHMPVLDGYQAAKNIRMVDNINHITPIFGLTADVAAKDNSDYNHFFNGFLLKPLEIEKLKLALHSK